MSTARLSTDELVSLPEHPLQVLTDTDLHQVYTAALIITTALQPQPAYEPPREVITMPFVRRLRYHIDE